MVLVQGVSCQIPCGAHRRISSPGHSALQQPAQAASGQPGVRVTTTADAGVRPQHRDNTELSPSQAGCREASSASDCLILASASLIT